MKTYTNTEKREIINKVINKFMKVWEDEYERHEIYEEYKICGDKKINIEVYDSGDYTDRNYYMNIHVYDKKNSYTEKFVVGRWWFNEYDGGSNWKCDNTIKSFIKNMIKKIL